MPLNDSPSFSDVEEFYNEPEPKRGKKGGRPNRTQPNKAPNPQNQRITILASLLAVTLVLYIGVQLFQSGVLEGMLPKGTVVGSVVDDSGSPFVNAEARVVGTGLVVIADANGEFVIEGVPRGTHNVVASDGLFGAEAQAVVTMGGTTVLAPIVIPQLEPELRELLLEINSIPEN
jgi:hypothetical protein